VLTGLIFKHVRCDGLVKPSVCGPDRHMPRCKVCRRGNDDNTAMASVFSRPLARLLSSLVNVFRACRQTAFGVLAMLRVWRSFRPVRQSSVPSPPAIGTWNCIGLGLSTAAVSSICCTGSQVSTESAAHCPSQYCDKITVL